MTQVRMECRECGVVETMPVTMRVLDPEEK